MNIFFFCENSYTLYSVSSHDVFAQENKGNRVLSYSKACYALFLSLLCFCYFP